MLQTHGAVVVRQLLNRSVCAALLLTLTLILAPALTLTLTLALALTLTLALALTLTLTAPGVRRLARADRELARGWRGHLVEHEATIPSASPGAAGV